MLTEPTRFDGDLAHLEAAAAAASVPCMRKDFLVDPYQVWEARASGAGGVLVIVRLLDDDGLRALVDTAAEAGLFVLVEAFDRADLERASPLIQSWTGAQPLLIGVNSRDLSSLAVRFERFEELSSDLPPGAVSVAESGVTRAEHAHAVAHMGYGMVLVGSALMATPDPTALARDLLAAGRAVRAAP